MNTKNLFFKKNYIKYIFFFINKLIKKQSPNFNTTPSTIVLSNIAHMGDMFLTVPAIKKIIYSFPDSDIDVICSSTSIDIVKNIKGLRNIYTLDHWKLNRNNLSFVIRIFIYFRDLYKLKSTLKKNNYITAIDFYPYYPNSMFLLWLCNINCRIGFSNFGISNLCTNSFTINISENNHITYYQDQLINFVYEIYSKHISRSIGIYSYSDFESTPNFSIDENFYIVIQVGSGDPRKRWSIDYWRDLIKLLSSYKIYFVGKGLNDQKYIHSILLNTNYPNVEILVDKLTFINLFNLVRYASFVISGDSLVSHIAYVLKKPQICILTSDLISNMWINKDMSIMVKPSSLDVYQLFKRI